MERNGENYGKKQLPFYGCTTEWNLELYFVSYCIYVYMYVCIYMIDCGPVLLLVL